MHLRDGKKFRLARREEKKRWLRRLFVEGGRIILVMGLFNLVLGIAGGVLVTRHLSRIAEESEDLRLKSRVMTAASALDPEILIGLEPSRAIIGSPEFIRLRSRLARICKANADLRFVYAMKLKEGKIFFLADAEPEESPDYAAPGDAYDDAPLRLYQVFADGKARTEGPYSDKWGQWMSGFAPIILPESGKTVAVLGCDVDAAAWSRTVNRYFWSGVSLSALYVLVTVLFFWGLYYQRRVTLEIRRLNERLRLSAAVLENTTEGIVVTDEDALIEWVNPAFERITGYRRPEVAGKKPEFLKSDQQDPALYRDMWLSITTHGHWRGELRNRRKSGELYFQEMTINALKDEAGITRHYAGVFSDITARRRAVDALQASESKYRHLYESIMDAFVCVDMQGRILEFNEVYRHMLGYEPEELCTHSYVDITPKKWHALEAEIVEKQALTRGYTDLYEKEYRRKDGTEFPIELRVFLVRDEQGEPNGLWAIVRDITTRKRMEEELKSLATKDPLTGTNNRRAFMDKANAEWRRAMRYKKSFSFLMIDIDHFKEINDAHGHAAGDEVLKTMVGTIEKTCRVSDVLGRWGGEEFGMIFPESSAEQARQSAERLRLALAATAVPIDRGTVSFAVSMGLVTVTGGRGTLDAVIAEADARLYHAKQRGRNCLVAEAVGEQEARCCRCGEGLSAGSAVRSEVM